MTFHLFSVLEPDLARYVALGWKEYARERRPSLSCDVVLIEWVGEGEPPMLGNGA